MSDRYQVVLTWASQSPRVMRETREGCLWAIFSTSKRLTKKARVYQRLDAKASKLNIRFLCFGLELYQLSIETSVTPCWREAQTRSYSCLWLTKPEKTNYYLISVFWLIDKNISKHGTCERRIMFALGENWWDGQEVTRGSLMWIERAGREGHLNRAVEDV